MNVFEYAMKMETDGRQFYLDHAEKASTPELKRILLELADDELKHYNLFKSMRDGQSAEYKETQKTTILATVKNVFEKMRGAGKDYSFPSDSKKIWQEAREVEKKAEAFYREKVKEVSSANEKNVLTKIADEEHRHWVTMEQVIQFLDRPKNFLADAEWSHLEE
jgi:rubrerythrin